MIMKKYLLCFLFLFLIKAVASLEADDDDDDTTPGPDINPIVNFIFITKDSLSSVLTLDEILVNYAYRIYEEGFPSSKSLYFNIASGLNANLSDFWLYKGDDFTNLIGRVDNISLPFISDSNLILYRWTGSYTTDSMALFSIYEIDSSGCIGSNIFLDPSKDNVTGSLSISSTSDESCEMFIVSKRVRNLDICQLWISKIVSNSDLQIMSINNGQSLLNLTAGDIPNWKNFGIYTEVISVIIPSSSKVSMEFNSYNSYNKFIIEYAGGIQKGIMASPSYNGRNQPATQFLELYTLKAEDLIAVDLYVRTLKYIGVLYYSNTTDGTDKNFLAEGQNITLIVQNMNVFFEQCSVDSSNYDEFCIEYVMYPLNLIPILTSTTPVLTTTSTNEETTTYSLVSNVTESDVTSDIPSTYPSSSSNFLKPWNLLRMICLILLIFT